MRLFEGIALRRDWYVAWYRISRTWRRQRSGLLAVVVLVALLGGIAMASVAAARRTQSSFPTFLASTNPSDVTMVIYSATPEGSSMPNPDLTAAVARLPGIKKVRTFFSPPLVPLDSSGAPRLNTEGFINTVGSVDGMLIDQDRLAVVAGRAAHAASVDEVTMTQSAAAIYGVHIGETFPLGLYTNQEMTSPGFGTPRVAPAILLHAKLVGIVDFNTQVVQDGVDQQYGFVFITPAFVDQLEKKFSGRLRPALYGIQLKTGEGIVSAEKELGDLVPPGYTAEFRATTHVVSETEATLKPESIALATFGLISALACLVLAAQAMSRLLRSGDEEREVMRSLGASPLATALDGLLGPFLAVLGGSVVAMVVAISLSPLGPIGPIRGVYPDRGVAFDGAVLGGGTAMIVGILGIFGVAQALRSAPGRSRRAQRRPTFAAARARVLSGAGLSVAGTIGVHFALEPGRGRTSVPVRSVLAGTVMAVALVVATLTFANSLSTLVSRPALYGWNWSFALNPTANVPPQTLTALGKDREVAAWTGVDYTDAVIDGLTLPIILSPTRAKVAPPILSGHGIDAGNQIVLGAATLAELGKRIGDSVVVSYGSPASAPVYIAPIRLTIVGTATLPAVGYSSLVAEHTSMGVGAMVPTAIEPPAMVNAFAGKDPNLKGPELVFVRMRSSVSAAAGAANLQRIVASANRLLAADPRAQGNSVQVLGVVRPAQINNYRSLGSTPVILSLGLALGAITALALALNSSVRRRRRDLALLKTLGFTRRQIVATIQWQSFVGAVVGLVLGIPIGVEVGRVLWILFARSIDAVPAPSVPGGAIFLVALGAMGFTTIVAFLPGRLAARTPMSFVLRSE